MNKKQEEKIINKFVDDLNKAPTFQEGLDKAFDNLPDSFFKQSYFEKIKRVIVDFLKS